MHQHSDDQWGSRLSKGSREAYIELYHRYVGDVYRYVLLHLREDQAAEDIVQETFIRVYRNRYQFDNKKASFRTWVHRIAHRLCMDHHREYSKFSWVPFEPDRPFSSEPDPTA